MEISGTCLGAICFAALLPIIIFSAAALFGKPAADRYIEPMYVGGKLAGYKVLYWDHEQKCLRIPYNGETVIGDYIHADYEPTPGNANGIHVWKTLNGARSYLGNQGWKRIYLVQMNEPIAEHDELYRARSVKLIQEVH